MATLVKNKTGGLIPLPATYGGGSIGVGGSIIIEDTRANVQAVLGGTIPPAALEYKIVPDGQAGSITPQPGGSSPPWNATAAAALAAGTPIVGTAGGVNAGQATSLASSLVVGLLTADVPESGSASIISDGPLTLPTATWDAAAGTSGGLTAGTQYFLSATSGKISATPPAPGSGDFVVSLGSAVSATTLSVAIGAPIGPV